MDSLEACMLMYQKSFSNLNSKHKSIAMNNLAVVQAKKGMKKEAIEQLKMALREDPGNALALRNYEILYQKPKKNSTTAKT